MLTGLFRWYVLVANFTKSKVMICHLITLLSGMLEEVVGQRCTVRGEMHRERMKIRIPCLDLVVELTAVSMTT